MKTMQSTAQHRSRLRRVTWCSIPVAVLSVGMAIDDSVATLVCVTAKARLLAWVLESPSHRGHASAASSRHRAAHPPLAQVTVAAAPAHLRTRKPWITYNSF
ncbi:hypothetical protein QBC46DRAFT_389451 [Diplogelasinospora grovesii]|uniref:Uncharacterized protein n=1 Tax=Diplogelasinospora grovesii TaxID=303347 RepID=A0AAN6N436_9PEZI|nr:hypothetical protein QBC46DRAFT_389451 [Diplogelasinospora grovesii]